MGYDWPDHLGGKKAFMSRKRKQYNTLMKDFRNFQLGCAYLPGYPDIMTALWALRRVAKCRKDWR